MHTTATVTAGNRCTDTNADECLHTPDHRHGAALGDAHYDPTGAEADALDALEAAWRAAVTQEHSVIYNAASDALTRVLVLLFGEGTGQTVRDEMADNFESWGYNLCLVRQGIIGDLPESERWTAHGDHDTRTVVLAGQPGRHRVCFTCATGGTALTIETLPF